MRTEKATISPKDETGKVHPTDYTRVIVESFDEAVQWASEFFDDVKKGTRTALQAALDCENYAIDLKIRAQKRQEVLAQVAGPDRAIARAYKAMIDAFLAAGMSETDAEALAETQTAQLRGLVK